MPCHPAEYPQKKNDQKKNEFLKNGSGGRSGDVAAAPGTQSPPRAVPPLPLWARLPAASHLERVKGRGPTAGLGAEHQHLNLALVATAAEEFHGGKGRLEAHGVGQQHRGPAVLELVANLVRRVERVRRGHHPEQPARLENQPASLEKAQKKEQQGGLGAAPLFTRRA